LATTSGELATASGVDGDVPSVSIDATLREALAEMLASGHSLVAVRDGETVLGALTAEDIRAALAAASKP
jgi:CBS domain-containing protein